MAARTRVAVIGGGQTCRDLLALIRADAGRRLDLEVVGVADPDPRSPGLRLARAMGVPLLASDYRVFFARDDLDLLVDLSDDPAVRDDVARALPPRAHYVDSVATRFLAGILALAAERARSERERDLAAQSAQLAETRQLLRGILENSRDLIFLTDTAGQILSLNSGGARLLGLARREAAGRSIINYTRDPDAFADLLEEALRESHAERYEVPFVRRDGATAWFNVSLTTIAGADGLPSEIIGIGRDVTERLRLQEDLIRADRLAAIGEMAAGVAHEINNPLAVIETIAGVIRETLEDAGGALPPGARATLGNAAERLLVQARRATAITHSLLGFARRAGAAAQAVRLPDLIDESLAFLAPESRGLALTIRRDWAPDLPPVLTDPALLQQVFVNLLKNAIDAIEEKGGGGVIEISAARAGESATLTVRDDGVGIPAADLGRIFDLFHTSKPSGKGTGLGLSIVHNILRKLGGRITVASEEGQWTAFTVTLPLRPPA